MRRDTRHMLERAQEVIRADAGHPREVSDGVLFGDAGRQMAQHLRDAIVMATGSRGSRTALARCTDRRSGKGVSDLLEFVGLLHRSLGACRKRCKGAQRRQAVAIERGMSCTRIMRQLLERLRLELERQTTIALAVAMGTLVGLAEAAKK